MRFKAKVGIGGPKQRKAMQEMEASAAVLSGADDRLTLSIRLRPVGWENAHDPWLDLTPIDIPAECLPAIMDLLSRYR